MKTLYVLAVLIVIMAVFFVAYGFNEDGDNQVTSSATKHSYDDNKIQPDFGDNSGMVIVTISGLD